jgi:hypothetical protein
LPARLLTRRLPFELADALMVEQPDFTIRREEYRDPIPHDEGFGMMDTKTITIHQGDRERPEGTLAPERPQRSFEIRGCHQDAFRSEAVSES